MPIVRFSPALDRIYMIPFGGYESDGDSMDLNEDNVPSHIDSSQDEGVPELTTEDMTESSWSDDEESLSEADLVMIAPRPSSRSATFVDASRPKRRRVDLLASEHHGSDAFDDDMDDDLDDEMDEFFDDAQFHESENSFYSALQPKSLHHMSAESSGLHDIHESVGSLHVSGLNTGSDRLRTGFASRNDIRRSTLSSYNEQLDATLHIRSSSLDVEDDESDQIDEEYEFYDDEESTDHARRGMVELDRTMHCRGDVEYVEAPTLIEDFEDFE